MAEDVGKAAKILGPIGIAAGAYFAGSKAEAQIAQGNYGGAAATGFDFGASLAGGIAAGEVGAEVGLGLGGPVGAVVGGLAGGIAGSVLGDNALAKASAAGAAIVGLIDGKLSLSDVANAPGGNASGATSATGGGTGGFGQAGGSGGSSGSMPGNSQSTTDPAYIGGIRTLTVRPSFSGVATHYTDPVTGATTSGEPITDASGRVVAQPFTASDGTQGVAKYSYDAGGTQKLSEVDLLDGTTGNVKAQTIYAGDGSITVNNADPTTGQLTSSQSYGSSGLYTGLNKYDVDGNIVQSQVVNADKSTTSTTYTIDANGNSTPNQITVYNGDGQKTGMTTFASDGSSTAVNLDPTTGTQIGAATFDPDNQLLSSSGTNANGVPWSLNTIGGQTTVDYGAVIGQSASQAGLALGSVLGTALGGNSLVGQLAASTVLGTFTQALATSATNLGKSLLSGGVTGLDAFDAALGTALTQTTGSFTANLGGQAFTQVNGHFESLLFTEAAQALGLKGFAGQAFTTLGTTITGQLETNLTKIAVDPSTSAGDLFDGFSSAEFAAEIGNGIGGALGSYLGSQLVQPVGIGGALGSAGGTAIGTVVGTVLGTAIPIPGVGTFIGSFIGDTIGTEIGDLINGNPHAGGDVLYQNGPAIATNFQANNGGTSKPIVTVATATADAVNQIIGLTGGSLTAETGTGHVSYYEKGTTVTVTTAAGATSFDASLAKTSAANWANATEVGTDVLLAQAQTQGGDPLMTAAFAAAKQQDGTATAIDSDLQIAQSYQTYVANSGTINALIAQSPDSAFSAGWALTLMRAKELGLDQVDQGAGWTATLVTDGSGLGVAATANAASNPALVDVNDASGRSAQSEITVTDGSGKVQEQMFYYADGTQTVYNDDQNTTFSGNNQTLYVQNGATVTSPTARRRCFRRVGQSLRAREHAILLHRCNIARRQDVFTHKYVYHSPQACRLRP